MIRIGLTGGIGSGKTTAANMFAELGAPVIDADVIARDLTQKHNNNATETLDLIRETFGGAYFTDNNELDRKKLAAHVFNDPRAKQQLENILHPRVRSRMLETLASLDAAYAILVIPLLFETDFGDLIDRTLVIDATESSQYKRVKQRDGRSKQQIDAIIAQQTRRDARIAGADDVLHNEGTLDELNDAILCLHQQYLQLSQSA